jgi:hypothetical protein
VSSLLVAISVALRHGYDAVAAFYGAGRDTTAQILGLLYLLQLLAAVATTCSFAGFARRPDVYNKTELVDQQHTLSLLSQFTFSWNRGIFNVAKARQMEIQDIPNLDSITRSRYLQQKFPEKRASGPLWKQLIKAHAGELALQWFLTLVIALLALFPQVVLYNFLSRIEQSQQHTSADPTVFIWVFGLLLSQLLQVGVNNWLKWITASRLEIPANSLLQSLVFSKALKQYETAPPGQNADKAGKSGSQDASKDSAAKTKGRDGKGTGKETETRQSVINHMKLDRYAAFVNSTSEPEFADNSKWPRDHLLHVQQQLPHGHLQAHPCRRICRQLDGLATGGLRPCCRIADGPHQLDAVTEIHRAALWPHEV